MTKVKLYTEDQVKKAIESARENSFGSDFQRWLTKSEKSIMKGLTFIELPSDEEIKNEIMCDTSIKSDDDFFNGAKMVINKIQGGNNEQ